VPPAIQPCQACLVFSAPPGLFKFRPTWGGGTSKTNYFQLRQSRQRRRTSPTRFQTVARRRKSTSTWTEPGYVNATVPNMNCLRVVMMMNYSQNSLNCQPSNCVRPCASATSTRRHSVNSRMPLDRRTNCSDATSVLPILPTEDTRLSTVLSQPCLSVRQQSRAACRVINFDAVYRKRSRHGPTTSSTCRQLLRSVNCSTPKAADQVWAVPDVQLQLKATYSPL